MMHDRQKRELDHVIDCFEIGDCFTTSDAMRCWRYKREITLGRMRSYLRNSDRVTYSSDQSHQGYWVRVS